MDERAYAVALRGIEGVGATRLRRLRERFGSLERAWEAPARELAQVAGIGAELAQAIAAQRPSLDPMHELERLQAGGADALCWWEERYPERLRHTHDAPAVLFARGEVPSCERAVAIVGTRRCTTYGSRMARALAQELAGHGVVVVSGLARGIDAAAHEGALQAGLTVAVLGSGLDRLYPPSHRGLAARIAKAGAVLTEYPLGTEPSAGQFPARNRVVAGLVQAVVVIEAAERSGAMITVDFALEQGREVMAVPGPADAETSRGPHRLIQQGARLVMSAQDVLDELGWDGAPAPEPVALSDEARRVMEAVGGEAVSVEVIGQAVDLPASALNVLLLDLELSGHLEQLPGRRYRRR